jgi:hypothetical protein
MADADQVGGEPLPGPTPEQLDAPSGDPESTRTLVLPDPGDVVGAPDPATTEAGMESLATDPAAAEAGTEPPATDPAAAEPGTEPPATDPAAAGPATEPLATAEPGTEPSATGEPPGTGEGDAAGEGEMAEAVPARPAWRFPELATPSPPPPVPPGATPPVAPPLPVTASPFPPPIVPASGPQPQPTSPASAFPAEGLAVPSLGPPGKRRHPAAVTLLSLITLGVYSLAWHEWTNREMRDIDARIEVSPGASALAVSIPWLLGLLCSLAGAAMVVAAALRVGPVYFPATNGVLVAGHLVLWDWLMLAGLALVPYLELLLPFSLLALTMTLERARVVQERVGIRPERQVHPVRQVWLLLIPVVGGLWHLAVVQSRLNQVWQRTASPLGKPAARR